jgi:hypothetical protein
MKRFHVGMITKRPELAKRQIDTIAGQTKRPSSISIVTNNYTEIEHGSVVSKLSEKGIFFNCENIKTSSPRPGHLRNKILNWLGGLISEHDIVVFVDDDDYFRADYLEVVGRTFEKNPDAWLVGPAKFKIFSIDNGEWTLLKIHEFPVHESGRVGYVAGSAMSFRADLLKKFPELRFDEFEPVADDSFFQGLIKTTYYNSSGHPLGIAPVYPLDDWESFALLRFASPEHAHTWAISKEEISK